LVAVGSVPATAVGISFGSFALTGPGPTSWDPLNDTSACSSGTGHSPVDDGQYGTRDDAFDGALMLNVAGTQYADSDDWADVNGQTATTWGGKYGGVVVSRIDTALQQSPTLRDLVKFQNPTKSLKTLTVVFDSNVGSDTSTAIVSTSSGDTTYALADRWVITNDGSPTSGDPVVTQIFYGKGAATKPNTLVTTLNAANDCVTLTYTVKVPAGKSRYLLSFIQMHDSNKKAKNGAVPFNLLSSGSALLDGVSNGVQAQIVNWNL
jgi:hypothetical protein